MQRNRAPECVAKQPESSDSRAPCRMHAELCGYTEKEKRKGRGHQHSNCVFWLLKEEKEKESERERESTDAYTIKIEMIGIAPLLTSRTRQRLFKLPGACRQSARRSKRSLAAC